MILLIDNYDSFTYNILQMIGELGYKTKVVRNNRINIGDIKKINPTHIIISPGPGSPIDAGISCNLIKGFKGKIPILGICLGHQCIGQVFGAKIVRTFPMHGKTDVITHNGKGIFNKVANPFIATRYHSLVVNSNSVPSILEVSATSRDGLIMGLRHKRFNIEGIQVHPESILTTEGVKIIANYLSQKI
jgi:anthranilate synthase/aminodeoxychorismate synthase-like glutamine amidotransferase